MIIDSHIHLTSEDYQQDFGRHLQEAREAGVAAFINVGAGFGTQSAAAGLALADQYPEIFTTVGIHPLDVSRFNGTPETVVGEISALCKHKKVVAVGESGLDYYYSEETKDLQKEYFQRQIDLAIEAELPIIVHARSAAADCLEMLENAPAIAARGGVFHCYSEDADFARRLAKLNFKVSFPGVLTFKNAKSVRDAAQQIPLEQIMIETDGPYLSPMPYRGKTCLPKYIVETAKFLAELKGISTPECNRQVCQNTIDFYHLPDIAAEKL